jgi:hypothetical protein
MRTLRRIGLAMGAFVIAWLAFVLLGNWIFGSANVLAYYLATPIAVGVYIGLLRRDRRARHSPTLTDVSMRRSRDSIRAIERGPREGR